ncbi:MAG: alpha-galactosidase [Clostridia bacterium]|nr:alpha-galactosidase [Clostridia bacterium]
MSIFYDEKNRLFRLDTSKTSYVIGIYQENYLLNFYYGKKISDMHFENFCKRNPSASFSLANPVIGENGFTPDTAPIEYGCNGAADFRISALAVRNYNGDNVTDIRYLSHRIFKGKKSIPQMPTTYANSDDEAETLEIDAIDSVTGALVTLSYTVFENHPVMTKSVKIKNTSDKTMFVERAFSGCYDFNSMDFDMLTLWGRHDKERNLCRRPLAHGVQGIESKRGVSGHSQNPFVAFAKAGATEDYGEVYAFNLVYSGNFSALAECDHNCSTRFIMGINPSDFEWTLAPNEEFYTPEVVSVYTPDGIGEMSRIFHRFYNNNLVRGKYKTEKRPLLINSWEAAYFDFDKEKLVAFAHEAKKLGVEMLVMDDGWFGKRNDDTNSLGDWFVNEEKLIGGLKPLIDGVNAEGLKFGIWYEPEMISPDSELFRAHPDWHVHVDNRTPMLGRHQYVLDVSREDVRENIWNQMYKVLSENKIDYVKWDFNRNISDAGSALLPPERKKEFFHRFILGTYDLMNRLVTTFPDILFEGCSGGGGRFDPAMLSFSPQIWTSDNTDPIQRLYIQFGTSMCYPASTQGAHVSACERTGYETKGNVAMWGTFGYELDPIKLKEEDKEIIKQQIADYHKYYWLIRKGDLYRIISPFDDSYYAAWQIVAEDKQSFLFTFVCMRRCSHRTCFIKFKGLDPNKMYKCSLDGESYSGEFLMNVGMNFTEMANRDGKSFTVYFE